MSEREPERDADEVDASRAVIILVVLAVVAVGALVAGVRACLDSEQRSEAHERAVVDCALSCGRPLVEVSSAGCYCLVRPDGGSP